MPTITRLDIEDNRDAGGSETGVTHTVQEPTTYDVGYCKPPNAHKFKPGVSGNPRGRPRKRTSTPKSKDVQLPGIVGALVAQLQTKQTVREGGRLVKRSMEHVVAVHLLRDLLGKPADRMGVMKFLTTNNYTQMLEQMEEMTPDMSKQDDIPAEVEALIAEMAAKYLGEPLN